MGDFYEQNYHTYHQATFNIDPAPFLSPLTHFLPVSASILDLGCGSGRDILWLKKRGYRVTGFERSPSLARLARKNSGCEIIEGDFTSFDFSTMFFDALISVGSLVHLEQDQLVSVLESISEALKPGGHMLITLKEGRGRSGMPDGRLFNLWQQSQLEEVFSRMRLSILDFSRQVSMVRENDVWLGYVLKQKMENRRRRKL